MINMQVNYQ